MPVSIPNRDFRKFQPQCSYHWMTSQPPVSIPNRDFRKFQLLSQIVERNARLFQSLIGILGNFNQEARRKTLKMEFWESFNP